MKSAKLEFVNSRFSKKAFSNSTPLLENLLIKEGALLRKISFDIDSQDALIGETGRGVATYGSFSTVEDATSVPYDYRKLNANQPLVIYDALYVGSVGFQLEIHRDGQVGLIGRKFIQLPKMYDLEVIVGELKLAAMLPTGGNVPHPLILSYLVPEDKLLDATFGLIAIFRADGQYPEFANVDDQSNLPVGVHGSRLTVAVRDQSANVDPNGFRKLTFNDSTSIDDGTILYNVQILDFEAITATLGGPVEIALRLFWKDRAGVTKTLDVPKLTVPKVDPIVKLTDVYIHSAYWSPNTAAFQINGFMNFYALSIVAHYRFVGDTEWKTCNVDPFARHDLTRQFSITDLFADSNIENMRAIETYITCVNAATALPYDSEIIQANMFPSYSSMRSIQYSYLLSPQPTNPNKFDFHLHILKSSTGSTMTIPYNVNATTVVYPARIRGEIFLPSNTAVIDAFRWVSFGDLSIPAFELYVDPVDSKEYYHCKISLDNSLLPKVADHLDYIYGIGFGDLTGRIFLEYDIIDQNTSETKTIVQQMETYANRFLIVRPGYPLKPGETISMVRDILYHTNDFALFIANSFVPDPTARRGISPSDLNRNRAYSGGSGSGLIGITLFRHSPFAHAGKSAKLITLHAKLNNDVDYSSFPCRLVTNGENYGQYRESAFLTDEIQYGSTELHQMEFYITFEDDNGDQYVSDVYKFIGSVGTVLTSGSKFDLGKISISDSRGNCLANEGVYEYVTDSTIPIKGGGGEGGGAFPTIQPPRQITLVMGHSVDPLIAFDDTIGHI
jgi:hypothetical protein